MGSIIAGTGLYVPEDVLTNADMEKLVDTTDEWITTRSGIKTRHKANDREATSDLATGAARLAIQKAGISAEELDIIVVATITPDMFFPSTACFLQKNIGAKNAFAYDIAAACSGFIYGVDIADKFLSTGNYRNVLVLGAETLTKITDYTDRGSCVLFGDGAGAVVLQPGEEGRGVIDSALYSEAYPDLLYMPAGGSRNPSTVETVQEHMHYIKLAGRDVFIHAVQKIQNSIDVLLEKTKTDINDVKYILPHQMNYRIMKSVAKHLGISMDKVYSNIDRYGNTSAASIPIALAEMEERGLLQRDDLIVLTAFGGGFTWGAMLIRW